MQATDKEEKNIFEFRDSNHAVLIVFGSNL